MRKWEDPSRHQKLVAGAALDTPLYKEVKRLLTETISAGEWKPGSAIPAEWKLAERFNVAVGTVRKAVGPVTRRSSVRVPASRPMPSVGPHCRELRINDSAANWRLTMSARSARA